MTGSELAAARKLSHESRPYFSSALVLGLWILIGDALGPRTCVSTSKSDLS